MIKLLISNFECPPFAFHTTTTNAAFFQHAVLVCKT